ncbi:hypothetical protein THERMOT_2231 [Bathymodiolus thermophilus thioautotrophic gill symbiont]|nr:hypothetical protein THERMOT_2231 [Bathymodiolus thermophilus thioautotrophic gill symbiont]
MHKPKKTTKTSGFQNLYFSKKIKKSAKKNPIFLSEKTPILLLFISNFCVFC